MGALTPIPLARLFAIGYRSLIDGLHERLATRGFDDVRVNHGFVLLAARDGGIRNAEIAALLGVTKQAASKLVDGMQSAGYVERAADPTDERAKLVVLTRRGVALLGVVEETYAELEADWAALLDRERLEALRADLTTVLRLRHGGALPPVRPG